MKYRLFLSDFDGTLVREDTTVSERVRSTILRYQKKGGVFAVATGRSLTSILPRVRDLKLKGLVIAFQGALIADIQTGALLKCTAFPMEDCMEVLRFFEARNLHIQVYTKDKEFSNRDDAGLKEYERICGVKLEVIKEPLTQLVRRNGLSILKVLVMDEPQEADRILEEAKAALSEKYFVTRSSPYLVEVLPKMSTKGTAVSFLSRFYNIPREEIAAIGDRENDLPMLEAAGGRFAVANAVEALKRVSTVVPSNEEDGVGVALEKYAMGERV